jgi:hypothetical protein
MSDPVALARAHAALEAAWKEIRPTVPNPSDERARTRLAYIVAALAMVAEDEVDLTRRAIERYRQSGAN